MARYAAALVLILSVGVGCRVLQNVVMPAKREAVSKKQDTERQKGTKKVPEIVRGEEPVAAPQPALKPTKIEAVTKEAEELMRKLLAGKMTQDRVLKLLSLHYMKSGISAYREGDLVRAERELKHAVRLWPSNIKALDWLSQVQMMLDKSAGTVKSIAQWLRDTREVLIQQKQHELERDYRAARRFLNEGDYERAVEMIKRCLEHLRWWPYRLARRHDLEKTLQDMLSEAKDKMRRAKEEEFRRMLDKSRKLAAREEQRRRQEEEAKIERMLARARDAIYRLNWKQARRLLEQVLDKDPENETAKRLLQQVRNLRAKVRATLINRDMKEQRLWTRLLNDAAQVPYNDYYRFPDRDFWLNVVCQRELGISVGKEEEPEQVKRIKRKLQTETMSIDFADTPLRDVISSIQDMTGLNIVIDPNVDATQTITLKLDNVLLKDALELICKQLDLQYGFREGVIWIGQKGERMEKLVLEIYNVSDIVAQLPQWKEPDIKILNPEEAAGPGGGGGGAGWGEEEEEEEGEWGIEPLVELIKKAIGEERAEAEGCSIEPHRGQIVVVNTPSVHRQIRRVLDRLRQSFGVFVYIEVRFITITQALLEDIGIEYRGLANGAQWIPVVPPPAMMDNMTGGTDAGITNRNPGAGREVWLSRIQHDWQDLYAGTGFDRPPDAGLWLQGTWIDPFQLNAIMHARFEDLNTHEMTAAAITASNRQRVYIAVLNQRAYIADYDTSGMGGMTPTEVAEPVVKNFQEGIVIGVRPIVSTDRRYVTINVRATYSHLMGPRISTIIVNIGTTSAVVISDAIEVPEIGIDRIYTSVTVPDGGTILLGGFRECFKRKNTYSIPIFGSIPIIGWLFRSTGWVKVRRDVLMLLTARILILRDEEKALFGEQAVKPR
ncbi:MAG: hypothetical protein DRP82_00625 [Planctomycetota bacterium]|nr:MAG: hypothetical protein DRP82_00625 [Planctomycetota bacterium]